MEKSLGYVFESFLPLVLSGVLFAAGCATTTTSPKTIVTPGAESLPPSQVATMVSAGNAFIWLMEVDERPVIAKLVDKWASDDYKYEISFGEKMQPNELVPGPSRSLRSIFGHLEPVSDRVSLGPIGRSIFPGKKLLFAPGRHEIGVHCDTPVGYTGWGYSSASTKEVIRKEFTAEAGKHYEIRATSVSDGKLIGEKHWFTVAIVEVPQK